MHTTSGRRILVFENRMFSNISSEIFAAWTNCVGNFPTQFALDHQLSPSQYQDHNQQSGPLTHILNTTKSTVQNTPSGEIGTHVLSLR